jgi:hypothetical protein
VHDSPYAPPKAPPPEADADAIREGWRAVRYAVLVLLLCAPLFAPLALIEAISVYRGLKRTNRLHGKASRLAVGALVVSSFSCLLAIVLWIGIVWFLSPSERSK